MGEHRFRALPAIMPGKGEVFKADPRQIIADPVFNVRDMNSAETLAHIDWLADEIEAQGFNPEMPLTVKRRGATIVVLRGHCRLAACLKLIEKGVELKSVPVMQIAAGTSDIDLLFDQESSNYGLRLDPLARARLVHKALRMGVSEDDIVKRMHWKSKSSIKQHLEMLELPAPVQEQVRQGDISPTLARQVVRETRDAKQDPEFAAELIRANKEENKRLGVGKKGGKVTTKTLARAKKAAEPKPAAEAKAPQPPEQPEQQMEVSANEVFRAPESASEAAEQALAFAPPLSTPGTVEHFSPLADEAPPAPEPGELRVFEPGSNKSIPLSELQPPPRSTPMVAPETEAENRISGQRMIDTMTISFTAMYLANIGQWEVRVVDTFSEETKDIDDDPWTMIALMVEQAVAASRERMRELAQ